MLSIIQLVASPGPLCLAGSRLTGALQGERVGQRQVGEKMVQFAIKEVSRGEGERHSFT